MASLLLSYLTNGMPMSVFDCSVDHVPGSSYKRSLSLEFGGVG